MKKAFIALATVAALVIAAVTVPSPADASSSGRRLLQGIGIGVGAAVLFGAAARAATDPRWGAYAVPDNYYYYPTYSAAPPVACPNGFWAARPIAFDPWGRPVRWSKPRFVCAPRGYSAAHYYYR